MSRTFILVCAVVLGSLSGCTALLGYTYGARLDKTTTSVEGVSPDGLRRLEPGTEVEITLPDGRSARGRIAVQGTRLSSQVPSPDPACGPSPTADPRDMGPGGFPLGSRSCPAPSGSDALAIPVLLYGAATAEPFLPEHINGRVVRRSTNHRWTYSALGLAGDVLWGALVYLAFNTLAENWGGMPN